jgi:quercetin dioxygenase-like cupin family protein
MMKPILFQTMDWDSLPPTEKKGEEGLAKYRTMQFEQFRVRIVEYSAGYKADHWCKIGHIVHCLEGEMTSELMDGRQFTLKPGMSYIVSDEASMHRSTSEHGVKLMIIDGQFLSKQKESLTNPWRM